MYCSCGVLTKLLQEEGEYRTTYVLKACYLLCINGMATRVLNGEVYVGGRGYFKPSLKNTTFWHVSSRLNDDLIQYSSDITTR